MPVIVAEIYCLVVFISFLVPVSVETNEAAGEKRDCTHVVVP
jgi:hypothetical protein